MSAKALVITFRQQENSLTRISFRLHLRILMILSFLDHATLAIFTLAHVTQVKQ